MVQPFTVNNVTVDGNLTVNGDGAGNYGILTAGTVNAPFIGGLAPSGDTTGATDTANVQAALNSGLPVNLAAGTFTFNAALLPVTGGRITGQGYSNTICNWSSSSAINAGAAQVDNFEISELTLQATGFDLITGVNCIRWYIHDCRLVQNSSGNAIWNGTTSGSQVMLECRFQRNREDVSGSTRTIEAWFLSSPSGSTQINQNCWRDNVCFNNGSDATHYWYHLQSTGSNNVGNSFENNVFEHAFGGMIWLESHTRGLIQQCYAYDVGSGGGTISNHLIQISKNSGGLASTRHTIINGPRNQSGIQFASNIGDISLDANCTQTTIISPAASGDLALYLNGSTGVKLVNIGSPGGGAIKDSATTAVAGSSAGTSPPSPVVTAGPNNESGHVTFGTGTSPSTGAQAVVTYGTPFTSAPEVMLTPFNAASAALQLTPSAPSSSGFTVSAGVAPSASQGNGTYGFRWHAVI